VYRLVPDLALGERLRFSTIAPESVSAADSRSRSCPSAVPLTPPTTSRSAQISIGPARPVTHLARGFLP